MSKKSQKISKNAKSRKNNGQKNDVKSRKKMTKTSRNIKKRGKIK